MSLTRITGAPPVFELVLDLLEDACGGLLETISSGRITDTGVEHCFQLVDKYAF